MALSDREAEMLDAMIEDPGDEDVRLVFADVLLERGETRGELIHLHADAAYDSRAKVGKRYRALLRELSDELAACGVEIHGGLSESTGWFWHVTMSAEAFLEHCDLLFAIGPIHHVRLSDSKPHVAALAACRHLRWVHTLELYNNGLDGDDLEALVASPHFGRLAGLTLSGNKIGDRGARAICTTPFERLRELDLGFTGLEADGFELVANAQFLPALEALQVTGADGTATLLAPVIARARALTELCVSYNKRLDDVGAIAIAEATHLRLESLSIAGCHIRDRGVIALASAPHLGKLRWLVLTRNGIGPAGAAALATSTTLPRSCRISIREDNDLDEPSLALLREQFQLR